MDPTRLMTQEATITAVTQDDDNPDEYGDPTTDTTDTTVKCWLHQVARNEAGSNNTQGETWAVYLPPDTVIDGGDQVTVDGDVYEVDGPPWRANNPRLRTVTHVEANLRRVT